MGATRIGANVSDALRLSKACCASSVPMNASVFLRSSYRGIPHLPSREMNRLRAAKKPVSLCTSLTLRIGPMLEMAMVFWGWLQCHVRTRCIRAASPLEPQTIFFGIQFHAEPSEVHECGGQVGDQVASLSRFHHYVIYIDGYCRFWPLDLVRLVGWVDLVDEASLHAPLIGGASVLQIERLGYIIVRTIWGDE